MLLEFGVVSKLCHYDNGEIKVVVSNRRNARIFAQTVGFLGRKQAMTDQLERIGASMEDYLSSEDKTEDQIDAELTEAATEGVRIQLLLDTIADAEDVQVSDDEFGHEIVHRAQRAQMQPQQYYDQLVQSGAAAAVFGDVRRGKALITAFQGYLRDLMKQGAELKKQGVTADAAAQRVDLTAYRSSFPQIQGRGAELRGVQRLYAWMDEKH